MDEKGIPYSDDIACSAWRLKHHSKGYKNIYVVKMRYHRKSDCQTTKEIELAYGQYQLAMDRLAIEIGADDDTQPDSWLMDDITVCSKTYCGTKNVYSDTLKVVKAETEEEER